VREYFPEVEMEVGLALVLARALNEPCGEGRDIEKHGLLLGVVVVVDTALHDNKLDVLKFLLAIGDIGHGLLI